MEPWSKPTNKNVEKITKLFIAPNGEICPWTFGMVVDYFKYLNQMKLETLGNFDIRINQMKRDLILLIKEMGSDFVLEMFFEVIEEAAKPTEQRFKELGDIKELLIEKKPSKRESGITYTHKITISQLAEKRYNFKTDSKLRCACPFHKGLNKTSFMFDDKKNSFKCWSCGTSGNLVQFVKLMEEKYGR